MGGANWGRWLMRLASVMSVVGGVAHAQALLVPAARSTLTERVMPPEAMSRARGTWAKWVADVQAKAPQGEAVQVKRANDLVNELPYRSDQEVWGVADHWATPVEMLAAGAGDCEDFAIAKYELLRQVGVPASHMRLVWAKLDPMLFAQSSAHVALIYSPDGQSWSASGHIVVLDQLTPQILPLALRSDLIPQFGFDHQYIYDGRDGASAGTVLAMAQWAATRDRITDASAKTTIASKAWPFSQSIRALPAAAAGRRVSR